ncbi:MAG TPA: ectonucleotide pyrophosphatase/phosphodiesterase [Opitutaceae bacterium]|nr:ectonucleotide pyrophosphatase/phosphodiesterase [Opitutaceae bacterium]
MKRVFVSGGFGFLALACILRAQAPVPVAKPRRPIPAVEHVVVIAVDGLRPDRLLFADAPVLRGLMKTGSYSMWMRTTALAVTLPSFTSMLTGVNPRKHGIDWDREMPLSAPFYSLTPTIFELASRAGYVTAMAAGKSKFSALNKPGTIAHVFLPTVDPAVTIASIGQPATSPAGLAFAAQEKVGDDVVIAAALKMIEDFRPHFMFIHLPSVDTVGHAKGWGSAEQLAQIAQADANVGRVLAALEHAGLRDSTVVIISADHGGAGLTHGPDDPRSRYIPWIVHGPSVRSGFDLTQEATLDLRTEDTCATACWLLGLALPANFDGQPVRVAFNAAE